MAPILAAPAEAPKTWGSGRAALEQVVERLRHGLRAALQPDPPVPPDELGLAVGVLLDRELGDPEGLTARREGVGLAGVTDHDRRDRLAVRRARVPRDHRTRRALGAGARLELEPVGPQLAAQ